MQNRIEKMAEITKKLEEWKKLYHEELTLQKNNLSKILRGEEEPFAQLIMSVVMRVNTNNNPNVSLYLHYMIRVTAYNIMMSDLDNIGKDIQLLKYSEEKLKHLSNYLSLFHDIDTERTHSILKLRELRDKDPVVRKLYEEDRKNKGYDRLSILSEEPKPSKKCCGFFYKPAVIAALTVTSIGLGVAAFTMK